MLARIYLTATVKRSARMNFIRLTRLLQVSIVILWWYQGQKV